MLLYSGLENAGSWKFQFSKRKILDKSFIIPFNPIKGVKQLLLLSVLFLSSSQKQVSVVQGLEVDLFTRFWGLSICQPSWLTMREWGDALILFTNFFREIYSNRQIGNLYTFLLLLLIYYVRCQGRNPVHPSKHCILLHSLIFTLLKPFVSHAKDKLSYSHIRRNQAL